MFYLKRTSNNSRLDMGSPTETRNLLTYLCKWETSVIYSTAHMTSSLASFHCTWVLKSLMCPTSKLIKNTDSGISGGPWAGGQCPRPPENQSWSLGRLQIWQLWLCQQGGVGMQGWRTAEEVFYRWWMTSGGLPWTRPLQSQVNKGLRPAGLQCRKLEDMSGSDQDTCPHVRPKLG